MRLPLLDRMTCLLVSMRMWLGMTQLSSCRQRATMRKVWLVVCSWPILLVISCSVLTLSFELALLRTVRDGLRIVTRKTLPCPPLLLEKFLPMVWPKRLLGTRSICSPLCMCPRNRVELSLGLLCV